MITVKGTTEHFIYYLTTDINNYKYYQIFERDNLQVPVALFDGALMLRLREDFPIPEIEYIYFDELADIIQEIADMKKAMLF